MNKATLNYTASEIDEAITLYKSRLMTTGTLPAQVVMTASCNPISPKVILNWTYKDDNATGIMIRRKKNSVPTDLLDGERVCEIRNNTTTYFEDEDFDQSVGTIDAPATFYYRAFPYNKNSQYQTQYQSSIELGVTSVKVWYIPNGFLLSDIPSENLLKTELKFGRWGRTDAVVKDLIWTIEHVDSARNIVYLIAKSDYAEGTWMFDANEPNSSVALRTSQGNSRYSVSGIRAFHNSDGGTGAWWTPQHSTDTQPSTYSGYSGFLHYFTEGEKNLIIPRTHTLYVPTEDGGGTESVTDLVWLPTMKDVGLDRDSVEGNVSGDSIDSFVFSGFSTNNDRVWRRQWWTASIYQRTSPSQVSCVNANGAAVISNASNSYGNVAPRAGLILSLSSLLEWDETDSIYKVIAPRG